MSGAAPVPYAAFGEDQLTGEFKVSDSGTISVPLLGQIPVAGLPVEQVAAKIA